jgi:hypothetical protein
MKTFGERKRKYIHKNKRNKKKTKYPAHRNRASVHKTKRTYVKSHLNHINNDKNLLEEFIFPVMITNTYTWWDCSPCKPKVY